MTQTEITDKIKSIEKSFNKKGIDRIFEVLEWVHKNCKKERDEEYKKSNFRNRTATEIIDSGKCTGCTDYALVFITLMRASGFNVEYVETIEEDWLQNGSDDIKGHVFAEVEIDGERYIVDPQGALIKAWYGKRCVIFKKGKDSWDIGIKSLKDLKDKFFAFREEYLSKLN